MSEVIIKCTMNDSVIKAAIKSAYDSMLKRYRNEYPNNEKDELAKVWNTLERKLLMINQPPDNRG